MSDSGNSVAYRDIPGLPGYRVGSDGTVWSQWFRPFECRDRSGRLGKATLGDEWRMIRPSSDGHGYLHVVLSNKGSHRSYKVHSLVLLAFVGPCPAGHECRHFPDATRSNNRLDNISWGTPAENRQDQKVHGTLFSPRGEQSGMAKLTEEKVRIIRAKRSAGAKLKELAEEFGVHYTVISCIVRLKLWRHVV